MRAIQSEWLVTRMRMNAAHLQAETLHISRLYSFRHGDGHDLREHVGWSDRRTTHNVPWGALASNHRAMTLAVESREPQFNMASWAPDPGGLATISQLFAEYSVIGADQASVRLPQQEQAT
jgi:hypothetical protein